MGWRTGLGDANLTSLSQSWLLPILDAANIRFLPLSLPPARVWNATAFGGSQAAQQTTSSASQQTSAHLEECIAACEQALGLALQKQRGRPVSQPEQPAPCASQQANDAQRVVVHNLFALEGYHIAEALGVPSIAVSACLVPYPPPADFEARFRRAFPGLFLGLQNPGMFLNYFPLFCIPFHLDDLLVPAFGVSGRGVRWAEVEHWMWPLFTERWGDWRQQRLCLREVPLLGHLERTGHLPPAPLLLYCLSSCLVARHPSWPESAKVLHAPCGKQGYEMQVVHWAASGKQRASACQEDCPLRLAWAAPRFVVTAVLLTQSLA